METYNERDFREAGINMRFVQDNQSMSSKGVLRGLHYQENYSQGKLGRVISGEVFDVAVDICQGSKTFGKWYGMVLSAENRRQFYISKGFAHGFFVLSDVEVFAYKVADFWHPGDEYGIAWNDTGIGIIWPDLRGQYQGTGDPEGYKMSDGTPLNLSEKDKLWEILLQQK